MLGSRLSSVGKNCNQAKTFQLKNRARRSPTNLLPPTKDQKLSKFKGIVTANAATLRSQRQEPRIARKDYRAHPRSKEVN